MDDSKDIIEALEARCAYLEAGMRIHRKGLDAALDLLTESDRKLVRQQIQSIAAAETASFSGNVGKLVDA